MPNMVHAYANFQLELNPLSLLFEAIYTRCHESFPMVINKFVIPMINDAAAVAIIPQTWCLIIKANKYRLLLSDDITRTLTNILRHRDLLCSIFASRTTSCLASWAGIPLSYDSQLRCQALHYGKAYLL